MSATARRAPSTNLHVSCVSENGPDWFVRVQNLALSLRGIDAPLGAVPMTANVVGGADPYFEEGLNELGVAVRTVEPVSKELGTANKLRMFELDRELDFDVLVAIDCDIVLAGDFAGEIPADAIGVKPADLDRFKMRDWETICEIAALPDAAGLTVPAGDGRPLPPYFNSGVLTVPHRYCAPLLGAWTESYLWLRAQLRRDPLILPRHLHWFSEQIALSLALVSADLPFVPLGEAMNFPTHVPMGADSVAGGGPFILHYHGEIDDSGYLMRPRSPVADASVEAFNRYRSRQLSLPYDGLKSRSLKARVSPRKRFDKWLRFKVNRSRSWLWDQGPGKRPTVVPLRTRGRGPEAKDEVTDLPNLIVIGSAKSGTTSMHRYLDLHPEISMAVPGPLRGRSSGNDLDAKEMRFFWRPDWRSRLDWYRTHFRSMRTPVRGEATPAYAAYPFHADVAERIHEIVPEVRIIYLVRDPIDRIAAHYVQAQVDGERRSFSEVMNGPDLGAEAIVAPSLYATQLERYLARFPRDQVLVVDQHRLRHERRGVLREVFEFLEVDSDFWSPELAEEHNRGEKKSALGPLAQPLFQRVLEPAGRRLAPGPWMRVRPRVREALARPIVERPRVDGDARARLEEMLRPEVERLREISDQRFDSWSI